MGPINSDHVSNAFARYQYSEFIGQQHDRTPRVGGPTCASDAAQAPSGAPMAGGKISALAPIDATNRASEVANKSRYAERILSFNSSSHPQFQTP